MVTASHSNSSKRADNGDKRAIGKTSNAFDTPDLLWPHGSFRDFSSAAHPDRKRDRWVIKCRASFLLFYRIWNSFFTRMRVKRQPPPSMPGALASDLTLR
jgi:hypothetical protein